MANNEVTQVMTPKEWRNLPENEDNRMSAEEMMHSYAEYYHCAKSQPAQDVMTFEECCREVAKSHRLGDTLVTGHKRGYYDEAAEMYANQFRTRIQSLVVGDAVEFAEWIKDNTRLLSTKGMRYYVLIMEHPNKGWQYTSQELYQLFTDSKQIKPLPPSPTKQPLV